MANKTPPAKPPAPRAEDPQPAASGTTGEQTANHPQTGAATAPENQLQEVPLALIEIGDQLLRHDPNDDAIIELAASIAAQGLLQPIGVTPRADGRFQLLFGGRRLAALRRLRQTTATARIFRTPQTSVKGVALVENIQRQQMTLAEECDAVDHLHRLEHKSPDQISDICGKSRQWVLRRLAVPQLPVELREPLLDGTLGLGHVEELARIEDPATRALLTQQCITSRWTLTELRSVAEIYKATPTTAAAIAAGATTAAEQQANPILHLACEACGTLRPVTELRIMRVCPTHLEGPTDALQATDEARPSNQRPH